MPKEFPISSLDHGAGVAQQRFHGMTGRGRLPIVPIKPIQVEEYLRYFLLRRAGAIAVEGAEHSALTCTLLCSQAGVGRNRATVQCREKAVDSFDSIEAVYAERNGGHSISTSLNGVIEDLEALTVSEREAERSFLIAYRRIASPRFFRLTSDAAGDVQRSFEYDDNTRIFLWKPEDGSVRWICQGVDGEIATPTAAEYDRSAIFGFRVRRTTLRNLRRKHHCDGAIPKQDRTRTTRPDVHIATCARTKRRGSSHSSQVCLSLLGDSRFPFGLNFGS